MRFRLTPRDTRFYDAFEAAATALVAGTDLLAELVADGSDKPLVAKRIREAEHASDEITHGLLRQLNSTFVTPFDREDIYRLAGRLDDVMDAVEAAADLVVLYGLESVPAELRAVVDVLQRAARVTAQAMPGLRAAQGLESYWIEVNSLENEADQLYRRTLAKLFGGAYDALTALKLKDVAEQLEEAADAFEDVANTVETIIVKES